MKSIDVSVVIPSYNSSKYIEKCISSVLSQQGVSLEIHVIDDKGTDNTREIIEGIRAKLDDGVLINHYREKRGGQSTARNVGINACRGEFIAFLDSDDYFHGTQSLKQWIQHASDNNAELVCAHFTVKDSIYGDVNNCRTISLPPGGGICNVDSHPRLANVCSCWQILYSRSFLNDQQLRFSTKLRQREDRPFFLSVLLAAEHVYITKDVYIEHMNVPDSSFKIINVDQFQQYLVHLEDVSESIGTIGEDASEGRRMFARSSFALCMLNLATYWKGFVVDLYRSNSQNKRDLVDKFFRLHAKMDSGCQLAENHILEMPSDSMDVIDEFSLDLIRIFLRIKRFDCIVKLFENGALLAGDLLEDGIIQNDNDEYIAARYITFTRGFTKSALASSNCKITQESLKKVRLVLHVGMPKTGSSYLQNFMEINRLRLVRQGIYYPALGTAREKGLRNHRTAGHAQMIKNIINNDNCEFIGLLLKEIGAVPFDIHTVVISSENILSDTFWNGKTNLEKIRDIIPFSKISIYGLHRDLMDWVETAYREKIANPRNSFLQDPEAFIKEWTSLGLFDKKYISNALEEVFGKENVTFCAYEDVKNNGGIMSDFSGRYDFSLNDLFELPAKLINLSYTPQQALTILALKKLGFSAFSIEENMANILTNTEPDGVCNSVIDRTELASMLSEVQKLTSFEDAYSLSSDVISKIGGKPIDQYTSFISKDLLISVCKKQNRDINRQKESGIISKLHELLHIKNAMIAAFNKKRFFIRLFRSLWVKCSGKVLQK